MSSRFLLTLIVLLCTCACVSSVWAHGGVYRGPGGMIPPEAREPGDPTPPPPPPATGPVTPPGTTPGSTPRPGTPVTPPPSPVTPGTPTLGGERGSGPRTGLGMDSWLFWYEMNKEVLQDLKHSIYANVETDNPLHTMGAGGHTNRSGATHVTRAKVLATVVPALLWTLDPHHAGHQDTESSAYIALAKVSGDPAHIEILRKGMDSKHPITREAAALSLGLLRRARPADQFDAAHLDRVRTMLFDVFESEAHDVRTRGFAALALGLLGDQPTASAQGRGAPATTARLFGLLERTYAHADLPVALLMAIGLQPLDSVQEDQRQALRTCVQRGRLHGQTLPPYVCQVAATALGRIGDREKDVLVLERALTARSRSGANVQRSAAVALGVLGQRVSGEERAGIAAALLDALKRRRVRDRSALAFTVMSLARLVTTDVDTRSTDVLARTDAGDRLLALAEDGRPDVRAYGALALGLISRAIGDSTTIEIYGTFRQRARDVLRAGLASRSLDARTRAAFAVALGLARDEGSLSDLVALVADPKEDHVLRGYAALGLGHLGINTPAVLLPIRLALKGRSSEQLRRSTAAALGMLRDRHAVRLLLEELRLARSQSVKGEVVVALAKVGDERAIDPLVGLVRDEREQDLTRALACAGLGIVGDLEWIPSLSRLSSDLNYRAVGSLMSEVLSIL